MISSSCSFVAVLCADGGAHRLLLHSKSNRNSPCRNACRPTIASDGSMFRFVATSSHLASNKGFQLAALTGT